MIFYSTLDYQESGRYLKNDNILEVILPLYTAQ